MKSTFLSLTKRSTSIVIPLICPYGRLKSQKMVARLPKPLTLMRNYKKNFSALCSTPYVFLFQRRGDSGPLIFALSLLGNLGTLCLEFLIWNFVFLVRLIVGWLKGSTLEVIARKETSYGDVLPSLFCSAFGKKRIVEFLKIAIILLILFGLLQHSFLVEYELSQLCNYSLSIIFNN